VPKADYGIVLVSFPPDSDATAKKEDEIPSSVLLSKLSVEILVEQVLARNPTLAQMMAAYQAAFARYPQAISLDDPMFGAMFAPASIGSNNVEFGYRLEISQKYPFPGKRSLRGEAAQAEASAAGSDVDDMRLQLIESAKTAFYDYYLVHRSLEVNDESVKLLQRIRESAESQYANNKASEQDIFQVDVELGKQRERGISLDRARKVAIARINTLMHLASDSPLPPPPSKVEVSGALPSLEALQSRALSQRPDLRALADRIAADQAALALAEREYYPDFEVAAAYDTIMGNGPARDLAPQVGVRLNVPVRRARRNAALDEAEAKIAQRRAEMGSRTDQVNFQVQESYEQVAEAERIIRLYEETVVPAAKKNVDAAQVAYTNGRIPLLSLIEAERNLVGLRDRFYEATAEYGRRRATLERATGEPLNGVALRSVAPQACNR
jgi:outer membrane protein TolC